VLGAAVSLAGGSLPVWLAGLALVGAPLLLAAHRAGRTGARLAAAAGATLTAAVPVALALAGVDAAILRTALWLAPVGALVALVLRRRALAG
ncbi:MAG: hypothetical protein AAFZ09_05665, partial [Pseudomonadota bacterium]